MVSLPDNHKPTHSSTEAPDRARLKPSVPGKTSSYNLTYTDEEDSYAFAGPRSTDDDQYVMYFDPDRQAFVLDKVDSTFNMNITRMPGNSDADDLSRRFPHLDMDPAKDTINVKGPAKKTKAAPTPEAPTTKRKVEKKATKNLALPVAAAPAAAKPKSKPKKDDDEDDDDEDDDDDGGLLIEYPEGPPATAKHNDFSPAFPTQRRFDDYMDQRESEADDADGESDDEIDMDFKLPSPVNKQQDQGEEEEPAADDDDDNADDGGTADLEGDLEKAMEIAFEDLANSQEEGRDDESEISEED